MATFEATLAPLAEPTSSAATQPPVHWFVTETAVYDDLRLQPPLWLLGVSDSGTGRLLARLYEGNGIPEHRDLITRAIEAWGTGPSRLHVEDPSLFETPELVHLLRAVAPRCSVARMEPSQRNWMHALTVIHAVSRFVHGARLGPEGDLESLNRLLSTLAG